jgi:hypothetical protein
MILNKYDQMQAAVRKLKQEFDAEVLQYLLEKPERSYREIASTLGCGRDLVLLVSQREYVIRRRGIKPNTQHGLKHGPESDGKVI